MELCLNQAIMQLLRLIANVELLNAYYRLARLMILLLINKHLQLNNIFGNKIWIFSNNSKITQNLWLYIQY